MFDEQAQPSGLGAQAERRRSQRNSVSAAVDVAWHTQDGIYMRKRAHAEDISAHGALLGLEHGLSNRAVIALSRNGGKNRAIANVVRCGPPRPDGSVPVAVELTYPSEAFWGSVSWSGV
jgi:hypothetical protein